MEGNEATDEGLDVTAKAQQELAETRDKVDRARAAAVQAWLASMPLGEELEKLRSEMATAKTRLAGKTAEMASLKLLIESTNNAVSTKQEEEGKKLEQIRELRRRVDGGRAELRCVLSEIAADKEAKDSLEQRMFTRRQAGRALQLAETAVGMEAHALASSVDAATDQITRARADDHHDVVALPVERHEELRKTAEAEEREAEARVEAAEELRRAAKARRAAAAARLDVLRARRREAAVGRCGGKSAGGGDGRTVGVKKGFSFLKKVTWCLCRP